MLTLTLTNRECQYSTTVRADLDPQTLEAMCICLLIVYKSFYVIYSVLSMECDPKWLMLLWKNKIVVLMPRNHSSLLKELVPSWQGDTGMATWTAQGNDKLIVQQQSSLAWSLSGWTLVYCFFEVMRVEPLCPRSDQGLPYFLFFTIHP